jgi:hypothetical protein
VDSPVILLPVACLWVGAAICLGARKRLPRVSWGAAVVSAALAWLAMFGLLPSRGTALDVSVWQPAEVFGARMSLLLDVPGWDAAFATLTLVLAVLLTSVARAGPVSAGLRAVLLGYASLGILTMWSGTFLTVVVLWVLLDLGAFIYVVRLAPDAATAGRAVQHLGFEILGEMLVVGAAIAAASVGAVAMGDERVPELAVFLLAGGVLLRLGLLPLQFAWTSLAQVRRGLGSLLRLVPPATGLVVLSRQFGDGIPEPLRPWLILAGGLGALAAGVRWLVHRDVIEDWPFLLVGLCGLGIAVAGLSARSSAATLSSCATLLILSGGLISLGEVRSRTHRVAIGMAFAAIAGAPFTPGGVMAGALAQALSLEPGGLAALAGMAAMVFLAGGALRVARQTGSPWSAADRTTRAVYEAGLWLPCIALVVVWPWKSGPPDVPQLVVFLLVALLTVFVVVRLPAPSESAAASGRWQRWTTWIDPQPVYAFLSAAYHAALRAVRGVDELVEGESSTLWVMVLVLMIVLALGGVGG